MTVCRHTWYTIAFLPENNNELDWNLPELDLQWKSAVDLDFLHNRNMTLSF